MARPAKPKPDPIEPQQALQRLRTQYGPTGVWDVVQDALGDLRAGQRSGKRDGAEDLVLDALAVLRLARQQVDDIEQTLLQIGHEDLGMAMVQLAPALGVNTRQAVEQRYQRKVHGASGANLADARQQRRARMAFAAWLADHQDAVREAVGDLLGSVEQDPALGSAGAHDLAADLPGFETPQVWADLLEYTWNIAVKVERDPERFGPDLTGKATRVLELHLAAEAAKAVS
jgi:hypothetical protein